MNHKVILGFVNGIQGGVDVFSLNLIEELLRRNVSSSIVVTNHLRPQSYALPLPPDVPVWKLPVRKTDTWPTRWQAMIRFLEEQAPCIYIPNYDFNYSCVAPKLSKNVIVVGIVHSDDPVHYDHFLRMRKYWNGIVTVSKAIADEVHELDAEVDTRLVTIPYGVQTASSFSRLSSHQGTMRVAYAGRLSQHQKRVLILPEIFEKLFLQERNIEITIIGDGSDRIELTKRCESWTSKGLIRFLGALTNEEVLKQFAAHDAIILTSEFEGMPVAILEAMGQGCVPVVSEIRSGIPELIRDGQNGFIVSPGDTGAFAERILRLYKDRSLLQSLSRNAYTTIRERFELNRMVDEYLRFFSRLIHEAESGEYHRPKGPIVYPKSLRITWKDQLPEPVRLAGRYGKKLLNRSRALLETKSFRNLM